MGEPWYQTQSPSDADAMHSMQNCWFYQSLHADENGAKENDKLRTYVKNNGMPTMRLITFEKIRRNPSWKERSLSILQEEVRAAKPYGSYRGFCTFVMPGLIKNYVIRMVREVWATQIINDIVSEWISTWIEQRFAPGGNGYLHAHRDFVDRSAMQVDE